MKRRVPFEFESQQRDFDSSMQELLVRWNRNARASVLPEENVHTYQHGSNWVTLGSYRPDRESGYQVFSHEQATKFKDIVDHKIEIIPSFIGAIVAAMHSSFMQTLYKTVGEAVEETGNVSSVKDSGSPALAFLDALKKIQFGVTKRGEVSRPEVHVSKEMFDKLTKDLEAQGEDFKKEVERITKEKEEEAKKREQDRLSRFSDA